MTEGPRWGAIALGGAVGTLLRAAGLHLVPPTPGGLPWITLAENLGGTLLLGCLVGAALRRRPESRWLQDFLGAGLLGSFTTFSALAVDAVALGPWLGAGYTALSVVGGLGAAALGVTLGSFGGDAPGDAPGDASGDASGDAPGDTLGGPSEAEA